MIYAIPSGSAGTDQRIKPEVSDESQRQPVGDATGGARKDSGLREDITLDQSEAPGTHTSRGFIHSTETLTFAHFLCVTQPVSRGRCVDARRCLLIFTGCTTLEIEHVRVAEW